MPKKIIFTGAATAKFNEVQDDFREKFKAELKIRKRIPGDETIEVTASDIADLDRSTRIRFIGADTYRTFTRDTVIKVYLALGILTFAAGLFYPQLRNLAENPIQLMLMAMGLTMAFASYFLNRILGRRRRDFEGHVEKMSEWHELIDRQRRTMLIEAFLSQSKGEVDTEHSSSSGT